MLLRRGFGQDFPLQTIQDTARMILHEGWLLGLLLEHLLSPSKQYTHLQTRWTAS